MTKSLPSDPLTLPKYSSHKVVDETLRNAAARRIKATWSKGQSQRHDQERRATLESKNKDAIYSKCFRHSNVLDPRLSPKHKEAIYSNLETFKIAVPRDVVCIGSFQLKQKTSKMGYKASKSVLQTINPQTGECKANDAPLFIRYEWQGPYTRDKDIQTEIGESSGLDLM
ncbi:hypothetical protein ACFE04_011181 [Oxalis oulophora]